MGTSQVAVNAHAPKGRYVKLLLVVVSSYLGAYCRLIQATPRAALAYSAHPPRNPRSTDRGYGGAHGILDENVVLSALARLINRWSYDETADLADLAAAYLVGFARSQGFRDGNKRTGLACALVFLTLNGASVHVNPAELYPLTMSIANNQADDAVAAGYFRDRLRPPT